MLTLENSPRRVRVQFNGEIIADSENMKLLLGRRTPTYFFPRDDVRMDLLEPTAHLDTDKNGQRCFWTVSVDGKSTPNAAYSYLDIPDTDIDLSKHITFVWDEMDAWYEEAEQILRPQSPYHRVDVRRAERHIRVEIDGQTVADTHSPFVLYETGLRPRYYLPTEDVNFDVLSPTETSTICPYKGVANYWSVAVNGAMHEDIVWGYAEPYPGAAPIKGTVCFYNEKVDTYINGQLEAKE
jgi:uncharacterized protein (DUF427 family)